MKAVLKFWFYMFNWNRIHDHLLLTTYEKQDRIEYFARRFGARTFVETGSYHGATSKHLADHVDKVITIEIDPAAAAVATQNCAEKPNITVHCGSSEEVLPQALKDVSGPTLFWLDAHYQVGMLKGSSHCPLFQELKTIFQNPQIEPIILIDDARKFIWANGWPSLMSVQRFVDKHGYGFRVSGDMICVGKFGM
ncbi:MAG: hypothetical protein Q7T44_00025 [Parvibaculum sp.]|nr:hypothetical protein [Parvibaculum sp.]